MKRIAQIVAFLMTMPLLLTPANVQSGSTSCPASGAKRISSVSLPAATFTIQAADTNVGFIYVGGTTIDSTTGIKLTSPGDAYTFPTMGNSSPYNLMQVWFSCSNSADDITWILN